MSVLRNTSCIELDVLDLDLVPTKKLATPRNLESVSDSIIIEEIVIRSKKSATFAQDVMMHLRTETEQPSRKRQHLEDFSDSDSDDNSQNEPKKQKA